MRDGVDMCFILISATFLIRLLFSSLGRFIRRLIVPASSRSGRYRWNAYFFALLIARKSSADNIGMDQTGAGQPVRERHRGGEPAIAMKPQDRSQGRSLADGLPIPPKFKHLGVHRFTRLRQVRSTTASSS